MKTRFKWKTLHPACKMHHGVFISILKKPVETTWKPDRINTIHLQQNETP